MILLNSKYMTDVEFINRWLMDQEKNPVGKPIFRVVWSDKQTEIRKGTFNDFTESDLYIRTVTESREVKKYWNIRERWILEKWVGPERSQVNELPLAMSEGSYEPFYVFESADGKYLAPHLKVVEFIINCERRKLGKMSQAEMKEFFDSQDKKALAEVEDSLDTSAIQSLLHSKEAIIVPSNYKS